MPFNNDTLLYEYNQTISKTGYSTFNVSCDGNGDGYDIIYDLSDTVYISNSKPAKPVNFKPDSGIIEDYWINITCNGSVDLEDDNITYNVVSNITNETGQYELRAITINLTNETRYDWNVSGLPSQMIYARCRAYDGYNLSENYLERSWTIDRAPTLVSSIANKTWIEDTNATIDISGSFNDPDGDGLNYTYVGDGNVSAIINNDTGIVILVPNTDFYGRSTIRFHAHDPYGLNVSSNVVVLNITNTPEVSLSNPINGASGYYSNTSIHFKIRVQDDVDIDNCTLYINGTKNVTEINIDVGDEGEIKDDDGSNNPTYPSLSHILLYGTDVFIKTINVTSTPIKIKIYLFNAEGGASAPNLNITLNDTSYIITASDVSVQINPDTWGWFEKDMDGSDLIINKLYNISMRMVSDPPGDFYQLGFDSDTNYGRSYDNGALVNGEWMVRLVNVSDMVEFEGINLTRGDWFWDAQCYNNQSQSKFAGQNWSLTVNNSAPFAPTFITPTTGNYDREINVSCGGGRDVDGDDLNYTVSYERQNNAGVWYLIGSGDGNFTLDTSSLQSGENIRFRCSGYDGRATSPYYSQTSYDIQINHNAPSAPTNLTCNQGPCSGETFGDSIELNCSGSTYDQDFNYTFEAYYMNYNGTTWKRLGTVLNVTTYGVYNWNTKPIINQSNISLKCYADDGVNNPIGSVVKPDVKIEHPSAPTKPINFNYTTDYKYQANITANGSTDIDGSAILYRVWAYYDGVWNLINDSLTNETVFRWNISSVSEQEVALKAQATDGSYYSDFLMAPNFTISREPTIPDNLTPETGTYEYQINYSCTGSDNENYFVYYIQANYSGSWQTLTSAFPGVLPVDDTELAYDDGDYYEVISSLGDWKDFTVNVSNGDYDLCIRAVGSGIFTLYWNCDQGDIDGSSCEQGTTTNLNNAEQTYCEDASLTKTGLKYFRLRSTGTGSYSNYYDQAYLIAKPFTWDVSGVQRQRNVDLRCRSNDNAGNSSWFNPAGTLSINRIPTWNSTANTSYSGLSYSTTHRFNLTDWFYDKDNDTLNYSATTPAYTTISIEENNLTITPSSTACGKTVNFIASADDNITQTNQTITLSFTSCPTIIRTGGGTSSSDEEVVILTKLEDLQDDGVTDDGTGDGEEEVVEEETVPVQQEGRSSDDPVQKIIDRRFAIRRHLVHGYGNSQITEKITNIDLYSLEDVIVRITIPKDIAETTDEITIVTPFRIIQRDPVIEFDIGTIPPYEEVEVVYVINNEITSDDLERIIIQVIPKDLDEEERLRREKEIEEKINETADILDITREVELTDKDTTYTIDIDFKEASVLYNVSIFEEIPKCLVEIIEEELIDSDFEFEIVSADPLIVWHFDKLTKSERIRYTISEVTEEECANQARSIALAQQIIMVSQRYSPTKAAFPLLAIPAVLFILVFFSRFGEESLHKEEKINQLARYAKQQYKLGRTPEDVRASLLLQGHTEEELDEALSLNAKNKMHHWLMRLEIGVEELILLFIIVLSVLDFLEILPGDLDFLKKLISWIILGYLIYRVSPTNILFGHKSKCVDIGLISGYFLLIAKDLVNFTRQFDVTSEVHFLRDLFLFINANSVVFETSLFIAGLAILIALSVYVALRFKIEQPSLMSLFHVTGPMHRKREFIPRLALGHLSIIFFFVVVFNLLTEWLAIAVDAPLITLALFFYFFILVKHKNRFKPIEAVYKIANVGEKFYERFIDLFHYKKTLLLGLAGMKLLHQITDIGNFLLPYTIGLTDPIYFGTLGVGHDAIFSVLQGHSLFAAETLGMSIVFKLVLASGYILNIFALTILLLLPALIWYHMYKYRELPVSKVPLFKLPKWLLAVFFASITVLLIAPAFKVGHIRDEGLVGVDVTTHSIAGFGELHLLLLVAFMVGVVTYVASLTKLRKFLKRTVIISALAFFAYYMWQFFANVVIYFVKKIALLIAAQPFVTTYLVIFLFVNVMFYITGFISYFLELFLRNEFGFKMLVEREWLGMLAHHDMHHIHYSDAHDEVKHGKDVESLARFIETEIMHSARPIRTIDKLTHHSWSLTAIEEAVAKTRLKDEYKKVMVEYLERRKQEIAPLVGYIRMYEKKAPIKKVLEKAVRAGWKMEDIRLAEREL
jgi:hypothetical protein